MFTGCPDKYSHMFISTELIYYYNSHVIFTTLLFLVPLFNENTGFIHFSVVLSSCFDWSYSHWNSTFPAQMIHIKSLAATPRAYTLYFLGGFWWETSAEFHWLNHYTDQKKKKNGKEEANINSNLCSSVKFVEHDMTRKLYQSNLCWGNEN